MITFWRLFYKHLCIKFFFRFWIRCSPSIFQRYLFIYDQCAIFRISHNQKSSFFKYLGCKKLLISWLHIYHIIMILDLSLKLPAESSFNLNVYATSLSSCVDLSQHQLATNLIRLYIFFPIAHLCTCN